MTTTDVTPLPKHPAKFSEPILELLARHVRAETKRQARDTPLLLVDPFAGVGRCHHLEKAGKVMTLGVEIEEEWARCHPRTICANSLEWMAYQIAFMDRRADIVATSPCYGNRFSDHHEARDGSTRRSYRHDLGRMPTDGSASVMPWGARYWRFHATAYQRIFGLLHPGGLFLLNVSDFVKGDAVVPAASWHHGAASAVGFEPDGNRWALQVPTDRMRHGENHAARVPFEVVYRFRKPTEVTP